MPDYDFSTLSPNDFELLSRDLLQGMLGEHLESFRNGRDGGIDLRYSRPKGAKLWIVQAKHFVRSGFTQLKRVLQHEELGKLAKLKPTRYIVTTSVSMTPALKDELFKLLQPYCQSPADILGREDLNNLLGRFPGVEKTHFKLWLPSTAVLERLLHNGIFTQSALELDDIKRQLSLFVPTVALDRALAMLEQTGFCMLTGIPGIGKTTTARLLVARHVRDDWEGIYLTSRSRRAFDIFNRERKQIFFFDDFLGMTNLNERSLSGEDKELHQLIMACRKTPHTKRLVLTTREHLYEQALQHYEVLAKRTKLEIAKSTVDLKDYTTKIRAQILVNHLYFYGIDPEVSSHFVRSGAGRKSLDHRNYNPRIVESMCEIQEAERLSGDEFSERFLKMLESPGEIWSHAFRKQLSKDAQVLLLVFAMHGAPITIDALKHHFRLFMQNIRRTLIGFEASFMASLK